MNFYPKKINEYFNSPKNVGVAENANADGRWASFICGVSVGFSLRINEESKKITNAKFTTNGCGFVIATADFICEKIVGNELTQLHGLEDLEFEIEREFGEFPENRRHCAEICFDALHNALAKYRTEKIEEWTGEKALICTCFSVSEERIESEIALHNLQTVEDVGDVCNAGTGCGSCQILIQEILDSQDF
ncbi:MAG: iron-sulfur cluster assembly scaffold protein [Aridibacter sp.]